MIRLRRKQRCTATIRRIWHNPPAGGQWYNWTYVLFEAEGRQIELKLSKQQARSFLAAYGEGDCGELVFAGRSLLNWQPTAVAEPARPGTPVE